MKFANVERDIRALQVPLEPEELSGLCYRALGPSARLASWKLATSGHFNTTYRLHFSDRAPLILRLAPLVDALLFRHEMMLLQRECSVQEHLAVVGSVIPRVVYADYSCSLIPRAYVLQNCLEGQLWDEIADELEPVESSSLWRQLGAYVRRIHAIEGPHYGYPLPLAGHDRYSDWLLFLVNGMRQDLAELAIAVDKLDLFGELLVRGRAMVDHVGPPRLVHGDLWPRNILVARRQGKIIISGILDAERAFWGEPLAEWIFSFLEIPDDFWQSYGTDLRESSLDNATLFRRRCYEARGSLQLILEAYRYGFDASFARRNFQISVGEVERLMSEEI